MASSADVSWGSIGGPTNRSVLTEVLRNLALMAAGAAVTYWAGQWPSGSRSPRTAMVMIATAIVITLPALNDLRRRSRWRRTVRQLEAELSPQLGALGVGVPTAVYTAGAGIRLVWLDEHRAFELVLTPNGREGALLGVSVPNGFSFDEQHLEEWDSLDRRDLIAAAEANGGEQLAERVTHRRRWQQLVALRGPTPALLVRRLLELARHPPLEG